ncbi:MAG: PIG-L family deacetylase, partial [Phycisphaeraceae bacterium]|nr:PIG-L family deacetylase [Phycisphaeraceae bacterium]
ELIRMHEEEDLSFKKVVTFNLDEYFPIDPAALQSYHRFMRENLFDHIDIPDENVHIPDGTLDVEKVFDHCREYEQAIVDAGGLDFQLLGIGRTGHVGFNEPGSGKESRTRLITLDRVTCMDAASDFFGEENVPRRAITMGVGTILEARRVVLMAFGEHKAPIIAEAVEGPITPTLPASFLQDHDNARFVVDKAAADQLTRYSAPWLVGPIRWDSRRMRKAVIWLSQQVDKPILKLTEEDYNEAGLQDLLAEHGPAYDINVDIFRKLQQTINGWPGGKPEKHRRPGDIYRPADEIFPKRTIVFSPHPDDDVISMGGTLLRLCDHGHEVHVAYQVSGNIAVSDDDAFRFAEFNATFNQQFDLDPDGSKAMQEKIADSLAGKQPGDVDSREVQAIKGLIRRSEAVAAGRHCGVPEERLHFLDMPFYETGRVRKKPLGDEDIQIIVELLREIKPHQIYAAGDLTDPHGTHRTCLTAILGAVRECESDDWYGDCQIWLYRGAWQEWEPHEIDMAVPLSPKELERKRAAIFKHESQKDRALFPGLDPREFWQRAEDRNRATAELYDHLGMSEYEGIEGFVRYREDLELE